jgi:hypothetical protein
MMRSSQTAGGHWTKKGEDDKKKICESNFARELTMCKNFEKERKCVKRGIIKY